MPDEIRSYKGAVIRVSVPDQDVAAEARVAGAGALYIDDQFVATTPNEATGQHWTYLLPYQEFESLIGLAEAVVDQVHGRAAEPEHGDSDPPLGDGQSWR